ncbi:MAG: serine hydrolase [Chloroflexi bacterium]|nr:serine hydrolase [Chloroflexota bacterium]
MRRLLLAALLLLALFAALLAPSYLRYRQTRGAVPPGVRLAGLEFGSADAASVTATLKRQFGEPVAVYYGDERILLRPAMVSFEVDTAAMLAEAHKYETPAHLIHLWIGEGIGRPPAAVEVPLRYRVDRDSLDGWLADIAARYDRSPLPPHISAADLTILPGIGGMQMDQVASRARLLATLADPRIRTANLILRETAAPSVKIGLLTELLQTRAAQFPGTVGLFLHHLSTGDEVAINADVAFSAMSTMKLAILTETYRKLNTAPDPQTTQWINETVALAGNGAANELLGLIGDGDAEQGAEILTGSLRRLGLRDSFMAAPYDQVGPRIVTAANSRTDITTAPDPTVQATPADIGLLLAMTVSCSEGGGTLLAAYPGQLTAAECQQLVDALKLNDVTDLIMSGLPQGTQAVHKHGYATGVVGDAAAVWGPAGPYVLTIFLHTPGWLEWDVASETMGGLAKTTWDYFALLAQQ